MFLEKQKVFFWIQNRKFLTHFVVYWRIHTLNLSTKYRLKKWRCWEKAGLEKRSQLWFLTKVSTGLPTPIIFEVHAIEHLLIFLDLLFQLVQTKRKQSIFTDRKKKLSRQIFGKIQTLSKTRKLRINSFSPCCSDQI